MLTVFFFKETIILLHPKKYVISTGVVVEMIKGFEPEHSYLILKASKA